MWLDLNAREGKTGVLSVPEKQRPMPRFMAAIAGFVQRSEMQVIA